MKSWKSLLNSPSAFQRIPNLFLLELYHCSQFRWLTNGSQYQRLPKENKNEHNNDELINFTNIMGLRLYEQFKKKHIAVSHQSKLTKQGPEEDTTEMCIAIPLKSAANSKENNELDENFIKVVEYEYSIRYLESIGVQPNPKNIQRLLKEKPLSSCECVSGYNNSGSSAEVIYIYPNKKTNKNFEQSRDQMLAIREAKEKEKIAQLNAPKPKTPT